MNAIASQKASPTLRLTPQQVKKCWEDGYYTAKGYLAHLLLSMKKAGWAFRIHSVKSFCEEWGIKRAAFYRAKAELAASGILTEKIYGRVDLEMGDIAPDLKIAGLLSQSSDSRSDFSDLQPKKSGLPSQVSENTALESMLNSAFSDPSTPDLLSINSAPEKNSSVAEMQQAEQKSGQGFGARTEEVKPLSVHRESSVLDFDDRMRGNLHPWQNSAKRNDYASVFLEYLRDVYLPTTPMYENKKPTIHHAKSWLTQRSFDEKGLALAEVQWQQFQESLTPTAANDEATRKFNADVMMARATAGDKAKREFCQNHPTLNSDQAYRTWCDMPPAERETLWKPYYVHPVAA